MEKEIISRPIPGITFKQVAAYSVALVTFVIMYIDLRNAARDSYKQGVENGNLIKELQEERKQDRKMDDARLRAIELQMRSIEIRMDLTETFIDGYNKQK